MRAAPNRAGSTCAPGSCTRDGGGGGVAGGGWHARPLEPTRRRGVATPTARPSPVAAWRERQRPTAGPRARMRGLSAALLALFGAGVADAQRRHCAEPRYRWSAKVDTALAAGAPVATLVTAVLATWPPPDLTPRDRCAARRERELTLRGVTGWVRRVDKYKDDGDWHIELTERQDSPPDSCIVVEIPSPPFGAGVPAAPRPPASRPRPP